MVSKVRANAQQVKAAMRQYGDRVMKHALPLALTLTARDAEKDVRKVLPETFDRPTPYTMKSTFVRPATRTDPRAWIGFRDAYDKGTSAAQYLLPNVEGGMRRLKRSEMQLRTARILPTGMYAVPGEEAEIDAYGNMRRGQMVKILSFLRVSVDPTLNRSRTRASRGKRRKESYFVAKPNNRQGLPPGIYRRDGADPRPVVIFVRPPSYRPRFRFYEIIERSVKANFKRRFAEALQQVSRNLASPR